jgi:hemoglobin/transferrin/lactoferrin receptor protein
MYRTDLYCGVAFAALIALGGAPALAQQATNGQPAIELETINVEGQAGNGPGSSEKPTVATKEETPLTTRVTREELDRQQVNDFSDIQRLAPGVSFNPINGSFNVRGLDRQRVRTTIDGIPIPWLNDNTRGVQGGAASFDFDSISQVDLIKGSDSSVFGSGGLGGVVALRTLEPEDLIEPGNTFGGLTVGRFDSRDDSATIDQVLAARFDNTFLLVQGGYRAGDETKNKGDIGGLGTGRSEPDPADYDRTNILVKLRQHVDGAHVFGITGERYFKDKDIDNLSANPEDYFPGAKKEEVIKRERLSAHYTYDGGGEVVDAADFVAYWQKQELQDNFDATRRQIAYFPFPPFNNPYMYPFGPYSRHSSLEETAYGASGSILKTFEAGNLDHALSVGGEIRATETTQYAAGVDNCPDGGYPYPTPDFPPPAGSEYFPCNFLHANQSDMPDADGKALGFFVQDTISFGDGSIRLTPGVRYDWYEFTPKNSPGYQNSASYDGTLPPDNQDDAISGKLRIEGDLNPDVTLYGQWAQGFRAPTATELYLDYGSIGTYLVLGNPELKPETSNGFEIGALLGDSQFGGTVAAFYNRYENFIDEEQVSPPAPPYEMGGITQTINRANVEIYGAEFTAHYEHESGWHTWGKFGAYVGRDIDDDEHLNSIPAAKAVIGIGYAQEYWGADVILTAAASRDENDVEFDDAATPSYQTVDFTTWWSPAQLEGLTIRAGVYNIFDETYYPDAFDPPEAGGPNPGRPKEFYSEPGRNYRVSASYKF